MQISRRGALLGASPAAVVAVAPGAVKASQADPVAVLAAKAAAAHFSPAGVPSGRGFLAPANGLRGSHCGAAAFEGLSCGRDRVR